MGGIPPPEPETIGSSGKENLARRPYQLLRDHLGGCRKVIGTVEYGFDNQAAAIQFTAINNYEAYIGDTSMTSIPVVNVTLKGHKLVEKCSPRTGLSRRKV